MHEAALKAQAKKMNVESLRSGDQSGESVEVKIAKVNKSRLPRQWFGWEARLQTILE